MNILALADEPCRSLWDFDTRRKLAGVDVILSCGDLPADYLEYLTNFTAAPILYVHGNHDGRFDAHPPGGCICIEDQVYTWRGIRFVGLGGCLRYNAQETFQYTQAEMARRVRRLRYPLWRSGGFDVLVTHAPARGLNDQPDLAHQGFSAFYTLLDHYAPAYFVHGHVHMSYNHQQPRVCTRGATQVINAYERYAFEIPDRL